MGEVGTCRAYVGVGSNVEPERNIAAALALLAERVRVTGSSTFYWTAPLGRPGQPRFLNGVWRILTEVGPRELKFEILRAVETALGRTRTADRYAPRPIDLDVLLYDNATIADADLRIPDPDIRVRPFVAVPLLELEPGVVLPDTGEPLAAAVAPEGRSGLEAAVAFSDLLRDRIAQE